MNARRRWKAKARRRQHRIVREHWQLNVPFSWEETPEMRAYWDAEFAKPENQAAMRENARAWAEWIDAKIMADVYAEVTEMIGAVDPADGIVAP